MTAPMRTVSFKLPESLDRALDDLARKQGVSRSAIVRQALEALAEGGHMSVLALAGDLVGSVEGPEDLSTHPRHLAGYGV